MTKKIPDEQIDTNKTDFASVFIDEGDDETTNDGENE
jgi:hypothetical protein